MTKTDIVSLDQLNAELDAEFFPALLDEILSLPAHKRSAAIADFAEIDPMLGQRLTLSVAFAQS